MSKPIVALIVFALSAFAAVPGHADVRRERTARRPYIIEVGEAYSISNATLDAEAAKNADLREYLELYGQPNFAEIQEITPDWPWETYEVRVYYLHRNIEADFGRLPAIPAASDLGALKFQGGIPGAKRLQIEAALAPPAEAEPAAPAETVSAAPPLRPAPESNLDAIIARMEAAADRATVAADQAAEQSAAAERAAMRTVSVVDKLSETQAAPRKRRR